MDLLDQSRSTADGVVHTAAGHTFHLPRLDEDALIEEPALRLKASIDTLDQLDQTTRAVSADPHLSDLGKQSKLQVQRDKALDLLAGHVASVETLADHLDKREAALLAVPQIHPTNAVEALADRELRDWWRDLPSKQRLSVIEQMNAGPEHKRLELALLRSPYAQADHEIRMVRESWNRGRRLDNPAEAEAIAAGRNQVEWGRRAMSHVAGIALRTIGQPRESVLRGLLKTESGTRTAAAFGFNSAEVERTKRLMKAEKAMQA